MTNEVSTGSEMTTRHSCVVRCKSKNYWDRESPDRNINADLAVFMSGADQKLALDDDPSPLLKSAFTAVVHRLHA